MSETKFNPLAESQARADVGRQIYEQFMERDNLSTSVQEHVEGHEQFVEYLESRPYTDSKGKLHDPITGKRISEEDAGLLYTPHSAENGEEKDEYASMSLSQLAMLSAEAEIHGDKTTLSSVDDAILDKIDAIGLEDEYVENDGTLRDKSELDNYYDRVMKLRDNYLAKLNPEKEPKERKALPMPAAVIATEKVHEASEEDEHVVDAELVDSGVLKIEEQIEPIVITSEEENDLPPIIVDDRDMTDGFGTPVGPGSLAGSRIDIATRPRTVESQEKKKKSWGKRILGGIALIGLVGGSIFAANKIMDDDNNGSSKAPATTEAPAPDSGVDFGAAAASVEEETSPTTTPEEVPEVTEAPTPGEASVTPPVTEEEKSAAVEATVASASSEQLAAFSGLDASKIEVTGDAWPSNNFSAAGSNNLVESYNAGLAVYNQTFGTNFVYDPKTTWFWNGDKVMNPAELEDYNELVKKMAEKANQ